MLKDAPPEEDVVSALKALQANIGAGPHYPPLVAAAGVPFLETDHVARPYLHNHSFPLRLVSLARG